MKRRVMSGLLVATMAVSAFAGCSKDGVDIQTTTADSKKAEVETTTEAVTEPQTEAQTEAVETTAQETTQAKPEVINITYWHSQDEGFMELMCEKFNALHSDIMVTQKYVYDLSAALQDAEAGDSLPDIISCSDVDLVLANAYWIDISGYYSADAETKNLLPTINEYGIGCFDTSMRLAVPTDFTPNAIFIDRNVLEGFELDMPDTDWTWDEMIELVKNTTFSDRVGMKYYGLAEASSLYSQYEISAYDPAQRAVKGMYGFDGETFDFTKWAEGADELAELKRDGYVAPAQSTDANEEWTGDYNTWFGATGHVAVMSGALWTYQNVWALDGFQEEHNLDIVPYVVPGVLNGGLHDTMAIMSMGGITNTCLYPEEAYEVLKFMSYGTDGWNARMDIYEDDSLVNSQGIAFANSCITAPTTLDEGVWARYRGLFKSSEENASYWDAYFKNIVRPVPYGYSQIVGYWSFVDQYMSSKSVYEAIEAGEVSASDFAEEATRMADIYHAGTMLYYFGENSNYEHVYGQILSDEEIAGFQKTIEGVDFF
ncbi:MAG: ABC transporter substrate-binding protein [Lachnospiraceae bacterium]|nr:ABC transporter substrate-binding protein [Lachnospiraceae bacterium]